MRKDIQINTSTHDIVLHDKNLVATYPFEWVQEGDTYLYGQITIPEYVSTRMLEETGVRVSIPYTPIYKPITIRIVKELENGSLQTMINPVNQTEWFNILTKLYNKTQKQICASQLLMVSTTDYLIQIINGDAWIWSNQNSDLINVNANFQNRNLMLQCVPSNAYRYPVSGVGLVRYLHSNLSQSDLADRLQSEFKADKVTVKNAAFNSYTGDLELDLDFTEADASV